MILPSTMIFGSARFSMAAIFSICAVFFAHISQCYYLDYFPHFCQMCANIQSNAISFEPLGLRSVIVVMIICYIL
jgi:glutathione S-transferase